MNPHFLSPNGGVWIPIEDIVNEIQRIGKQNTALEGITVLGGEPFDQAEALIELVEAVRGLDLSTMVYTGHIYEDLQQRGSVAGLRLLEIADVLVDGPFLLDQYDGTLSWRGSRNQRLIPLTARYTLTQLEEQYVEQGKAFSIALTPSGLLSVGGLQEREGAKRIEERYFRRRPS